MKKTLFLTLLSLLIFSACEQSVDLSNTGNSATSEQTGMRADQNTDQEEVAAPDGDTESDSGELTGQQSEIFIVSPIPGETVSSPLLVKGRALGNWYFEGVLPVSMENESGNLLAAAPARALSDWMTEDYVEFEATLTFDPADNERAVIIIKNDNPSGLAENSKQFQFPVKLAGTEEATDREESDDENSTADSEEKAVFLFYGNSETDPEMMMCERVRSVKRMMPVNDANAEKAISLLLQGPADEEKEEGFFTSIPAAAELNSFRIEDGVAYADFSAGLEDGVAGSCAVTAIRAQIEATIIQFEPVKEVVISVEGRTEDILQP